MEDQSDNRKNEGYGDKEITTVVESSEFAAQSKSSVGNDEEGQKKVGGDGESILMS